MKEPSENLGHVLLPDTRTQPPHPEVRERNPPHPDVASFYVANIDLRYISCPCVSFEAANEAVKNMDTGYRTVGCQGRNCMVGYDFQACMLQVLFRGAKCRET